jgi:hypothetical protein
MRNGNMLHGVDVNHPCGIHFLCNEVSMRRLIIGFVVVSLLIFPVNRKAYATLPTFDAVNAALNELRNALMQSQFAQDIALAIERLNQLKATYLEMLRFNSGIDDLLETWVGDPLNEFLSLGRNFRFTFPEFPTISPQIDLLKTAQGPTDIRNALETLTGAIPQTDQRPYIVFEEMQVVEGLDLAQQIRQAGENTREAARSIFEQAKTVSPKGAGKLQTQALSHVIELNQQNQEAMAKLLELEATQIEQVSRDEKRLESERIKYMNDANSYLQLLLSSRG